MTAIRQSLSLTRQPRRTAARGGYIYLAVLFTSLIVVASVAGALSISTSSVRSENDRRHRMAALRLAESELHRQATIIRSSGLWRTEATNGLFSAWYPLTVNGIVVTGTSQVRVRFTDSDGQLNDDNTDSVELTIHTKVERSEAAITAILEPDPIPLEFVRYAVTSTDKLLLQPGGTLSCENAVQVAGQCPGDSTALLTTPRLECSGQVDISLRGELAASAIKLPSGNLLDEYIAKGTEIPSASIPQLGGDLLFRDIVLSPTLNPYGGLDPAGIYWFDAQGKDVQISYCRMDATLAIRNAAKILISGGMTWGFPTSPDAILIADADMRFLNVEATLDEAARSTNFNPASSPYRQTLANTNSSDIYPSELRGVIYTTGKLRFEPLVGNANLPITGAIFCSELRIDGDVSVRALDELLENPSAGLSDPTPMRFVRGSQRRIPSP